jgi:hypothetical protein
VTETQAPTQQTPGPIRIVPVHPEEEALAAPATAHLTYRGGALLNAVAVVTVFWGSWWQTQQSLIEQINAFFDAILQSPFMETFREYSFPGKTMEPGERTGTATITTSDPGPAVSNPVIQAFLLTTIGAELPVATSDTLYMVYLPPGTSVSTGSGSSCTTFCGYHDAIDESIFYGVLPYPDCSGCLGGLRPFDALTQISSHELAEAITDPVPGTGWYDDANGEIGDICAWQTESIAGYTVQKEWSNVKGACV